MTSRRARTDTTSLLWHPHQRLWNWALVDKIQALPLPSRARELVIQAVIAVDSGLLAISVWWRTRRGPETSGASRPRVLYVDCGVHKVGEQIRKVDEWFADSCDLTILAFEANGASYHAALDALHDVDNLDLRHEALVGPSHEGETVELHLDGDSGKGDSLFAARGEVVEEVPARRLSEILRVDYPWYSSAALLIRMNIEGAEMFVIDDLCDAGMVDDVDGFYGMWDDLSKIDPELDGAFLAMLRGSGITTVTFNDRDMPHLLRMDAVRRSMQRAIARASKRQ